MYFTKDLKRPYFPKDTHNPGKVHHKTLAYANAKLFVIEELSFAKVRQENDKCLFLVILKNGHDHKRL